MCDKGLSKKFSLLILNVLISKFIVNCKFSFLAFVYNNYYVYVVSNDDAFPLYIMIWFIVYTLIMKFLFSGTLHLQLTLLRTLNEEVVASGVELQAAAVEEYTTITACFINGC